MTEEKIELTLELPRKLHQALTWYAERTLFWLGPDSEAGAVEALIVHAVKSFLEAEADNPKLAIDLVHDELGRQLEA